MRAVLAALALQVAGAVSLTVGATLIFPPAGFVVAGFFLLAFGVAMGRDA